MHASYLLNKTRQAIKYGACKLFFKPNSPTAQNTVQASYILYKLTKRSKYGACNLFIKQNFPSHENTVHPSYLLNKTHQAIKIQSKKVIY